MQEAITHTQTLGGLLHFGQKRRHFPLELLEVIHPTLVRVEAKLGAPRSQFGVVRAVHNKPGRARNINIPTKKHSREIHDLCSTVVPRQKPTMFKASSGRRHEKKKTRKYLEDDFLHAGKIQAHTIPVAPVV